LIESAFLPFVIFVFAPIDNYLLAPNDYTFSLVNIIVCFGALFFIAWMILAAFLFLLPESKRGYIAAFLFFIGIALYIQGNFLNNNYGILDGRTIDWSIYATRGIISIFSVVICIVAVVAIVIIFRKKDFEKIIAVICCILMGTQLFTCATQLVIKRSIVTSNLDTAFFISQKGMLELSSDNNTIVFVVDCLDTRDIQNFIDTDDSFIHKFEDFTFFSDCVSVSGYTYISIPFILAGQIYLNEQSISEYDAEIYQNSLLMETLRNNGYDIGLYSSCSCIPRCV